MMMPLFLCDVTRVVAQESSMRLCSLGPAVMLTVVGLSGLEACAPTTSASAAPPGPAYRLEATVQDLMEGLIDPTADSIWDSVAYISSPAGIEDRQPRTDEQWRAVRTQASLLIEGGNLLAMPGRRGAVDRPGHTAPAPGELTHAEIQQRLDTLHGAFVTLAHGLQEAGARALLAIDARNTQALLDAGTAIDEACEACHVVFWYPNQQRP
jgi:hypothetical protein